MPPTITIYRTIEEKEQGQLYVYYREEAEGVTGPIVEHKHVVLPTFGDTPLAKPDWTNEDERNALAAHLGIAATAIRTTVYVPPVAAEVPA
jgi:hypothetical protein